MTKQGVVLVFVTVTVTVTVTVSDECGGKFMHEVFAREPFLPIVMSASP